MAGDAPLGVVIPHHSRADLLVLALRAVAAWPRLVVDDGPAARPSPVLPPGVELLRTTGEQGFARSCNLGLEHAQRRWGVPWVLLLNDDARPEPGCVEALLEAARAGAGAAGPLLLDESGRVESAGLRLERWGRVRQITRPPGRNTQVDALSGACLLVPADARLDPRFPHGFEDLALCRALAGAGRPCVLVPGARCVHRGGATLARRARRAQRHATHGHLRLVGGGWRSPLVLGLGVLQVLREGGPAGRLLGIAEGWRDYRRDPS